MTVLCPVCGKGHELAVRDGRLRLIGCPKVPKDLMVTSPYLARGFGLLHDLDEDVPDQKEQA